MIRFREIGFYTTIQDRGRFGFRHLGVPVAGALDQVSFENSNLILGNPLNTAAFELTMLGPTIELLKRCCFCVTGADIEIYLNEEVVPMNTAVIAEKDSQLKIGRVKNGLRSYLNFKGGFSSEIKLDSASQFSGITTENRVKAKSTYELKEDLTDLISEHKTNALIRSIEHSALIQLDVYKGVDFKLFPLKLIESLTETEFTIGSSVNRMACQLNTNSKLAHTIDRLSSPTYIGAVQCTPSGKLLILMRDSQTTGGYPRLLQCTRNAVNRLSQIRPNQRLKFVLID
tara:strand:+ start:15233 stop:16090 length:858 start_codon:yes stop_codon:yes gene_type:complete